MPINNNLSALDALMSRERERVEARERARQAAEAQRRPSVSDATNSISNGYDYNMLTWTNIAGVGYETIPGETVARRASRSISEMLGREPSQLMQRRKNEKEEVERFIETGASEQTKYVDESGTLFVLGYDMGETHILFTLDGEAITAQEKRSKHLKPLLTKLAKREGLELRFIDTPPEFAGGTEVLYYAFKNRGEVDDTQLVTVSQPRFRIRGEQMEHDESGCGDPECVGCYGDEDDEDDEGEELW